MFITDSLTPAETLSELLGIKGYTKDDTERFTSLQHNKDLCPGFCDRASTMLDAYASHRTDVHDIQGARDEGVDVMLKYKQDGSTRRLGLQIKSYNEFKKWEQGKDDNFVQRLKAQYTSAVNNAQVDDYYLLLCTDETEHQNQIRLICSEFKLFDSLKIVEPRQTLAFYELANEEVHAYVTQLLCKDDSMLKAALRCIGDMSRDYAYMVLALICRAFEGEVELTDEDLVMMYEEYVANYGGRHAI
jgi:hypothetical protein